jgi:RHS repeat-associated protein
MKPKLFAIAALSASLLAPRAVGAVGLPAPGAVSPQTVKVPDGPGSVRGLANDATVSSFTGQVAYQVPIELPAGPGGLTPKLELSYSGALGNGPLGLGWSLGQVAVRRSLRLGVPAYNDSDELELSGLAGPTLVNIGNGQFRAEGQGNSIRGVAVDGGYELIDAAGTRYRIGTSDASRQASGTRVAAWYLERVTDVAGHVIDYHYQQLGGEVYLTEIVWGGLNAFRAELVYEDRADQVVSWRTGFRVATGRRLTAIRVWSFGGLRRTVALAYDQSLPQPFALTRLSSVKVVGPDGVESPATTFSYAAATPGVAQSLSNTGGWTLTGGTVSFFDVDKDGAMDLLRIEAGNHRYRRNIGGGFGAEVPLTNAPALSMSSVRMLDLDGDSGAEMVTKSGTTWRSYRIVNNGWVATDWPGGATLDLQTVAVADLNGDNRMDVLASSGSGISAWFGTANGFGAPRTLPAISPGETSITPATAQFPDLNGDGLADAVLVSASGLIELRGRGDGTFERIGPVAYPWTGTTDPTQVRLADLDRDGILDLVRIGSAQVFWYRGKVNATFSTTATILNRPPGADTSTVVSLADANGNGSTDVVWSSPTGMWALDLAGPTNAGLLASIDNGLGKVQRFDYTASAQLAFAAESAGAPWTERMPVSIAVTTTLTSVLATGEPDRASLLSVRDGIYDAVERRFIGFAQTVRTLPGAGLTDTIRTITIFHPGRGVDRALRGQVLSERTEDGSGRVFQRVDNQVAALTITGLPADARLKRAAVTQTDTTKQEPGEAPAVLRTRFVFDGEGRLTEERRDGRVVTGVPLDGDESILQHLYTAEDPVTGVRDLIYEDRLLDGNSVEVSRQQRRFGDATSIAAVGAAGKGWLREASQFLAQETRWVLQQRTSYDTDGNPVVAFANGVERTLGYDAHGLHPVSETVSPATGQTLVWTAQWDDVAGTLVNVAGPDGVARRMTYDGIGRLTSLAANGAAPHLYYRYAWSGPRPRTETFLFDGDPATLGPLPATWTANSGWRHSVTVNNGAGEQLLTATRLDVTQWNVGEFRQRDQRGRVIALTSPFAFQGADPSVATPPINAATQRLVYDPLDRVIDEVLPTGSHKRATYHPLGVSVAVDGLATVTSTVDGQDRITHTERTVGTLLETVDASYDAAGRVLQFRLQGDAVHHDFTYDSLGRLIRATDPDIGPRSMAYDDGGRLVRSENGAGQAVSYGYDGAGRLLSVDGLGVTTRYHYDLARRAGFAHTGGQLAWVEEPTGTVDFGYDDMGRLATQERAIVEPTATITGRETTAFAPSGLARTIDLGDGVVLPVRYDPAGRLSQIEGVWSVESYDAAGNTLRERFGNNLVQRFERDALRRPTRVTVESATSAFYDVTAHYSAFGAIDTLTDTDGAGLDHSATFGFDGGGRLTSAAIGALPTSNQFRYAYDGLQNMSRRDGPAQLGILAGTYEYSPQSPRRLARIVTAAGAPIATFAYDAAGRQTQHADKLLQYDALSHLTRVDLPGGAIAHRYGYDGSRVATKSTTGEMTYWITPNVVVRGAERDHYVHVGDRLLAKITTSVAAASPSRSAAVMGLIATRAGAGLLALLSLVGLVTLRRRLRPGLRGLRAALAAGLALLLTMAGCGAPTSVQSSALIGARVTYFHQAFSAGPELTTSSTGQLDEDRRTEPFGAAIDAFRDGVLQPVDYRRDPINALNKFTDPETQWSFHGARWLAPDTAQWHTPDPPVSAPDPSFMAQPWALHPYQYVNQNPVAYWDPDGREPKNVQPADENLDKLSKIEKVTGVAGTVLEKGAALFEQTNTVQAFGNLGKGLSVGSDAAAVGGAFYKFTKDPSLGTGALVAYESIKVALDRIGPEGKAVTKVLWVLEKAEVIGPGVWNPSDRAAKRFDAWAEQQAKDYEFAVKAKNDLLKFNENLYKDDVSRPEEPDNVSRSEPPSSYVPNCSADGCTNGPWRESSDGGRVP